MMLEIWFCLLVLATIPTAAVRADDATPGSTAAFEKAYAESFYQFDACGDGIAGRIFRTALTEKLKQCPFSAEAKTRFRAHSAAQRRQSSQAMAKMIEQNGGLPVRLDGMTRTCHEQMDSPEYRAVRSRLDDFAAGKSGPEAVVTQPCDAAEITP
jgi:hypothetical protein